MADYYPLITRAVAGLEKNTGEARRALYDRARTALVEQLRGVTPSLSESDITRERLALEEAVRRVESEAIRQLRPPGSEPAERRPATAASPPEELPPATAPPIGEPTPQSPAEPEHVAEQPTLPPDAGPAARETARPAFEIRRSERRWLDKKPAQAAPLRTPSAGAGAGRGGAPMQSRGVSAHAQRAAHDAQPASASPEAEPDRAEARRAAPRTRMPERRIPTPKDMDLGIDTLESNEPPYRPSATRTLEPPGSPESMRYVSERARREQEQDQEAKPITRRMMNGVVAVIIAAVLIALIGATAYWQSNNLLALVSGTFSSVRGPATKSPPDAAQQRAKIPDRVGQQDSAPPSQQTEAPVAQRVVLYEEDPTDSAGKRFAGTVLWRTEMVSPGAGQPPDRTVRADITIPERGMQVTWSLRRNSDKDLPASHTVSIMFNLPADFPHGEVAEIRGVLMKQSEQTRGVSLAGLSVKVTTGFFLIGLSATEAEMQRNVQMLKERSWFDIAIVYKDGRRAILAVEKGTPGERAFADGFAAWGQ